MRRHKQTLILQLLALVAVLVVSGIMSYVNDSSAQTETDYEIKREPVIYSQKIPPVKSQTLASLMEDLKYESLINCLAYYESRNNPEAYNRWDPKTPSIGCLQFKRSTWEYFDCSGSIWNCNDQKRCADSAIRNNWNAVYHWSVANKCLGD